MSEDASGVQNVERVSVVGEGDRREAVMAPDKARLIAIETDGARTSVTVNGVKLFGVTSVVFRHDVGELPRLKLTIFGDPEGGE